MNTKIRNICENDNLEEIKKIVPNKLPINQMILFFENKLDDFNYLINNDTEAPLLIYNKIIKIKNCLQYLKKII